LGFTNFMTQLNKAVAGFHLLAILSNVDGNIADEESEIAGRYISKHFKDEFLPKQEMQFLKLLKKEEYFLHFKECMDQFYSKSSVNERADFIKFAVDMVKADREITSEENLYLNELLTGWEPEHAG
jgi:uncharacterized tellurite resistance protein B-like protein